MCVGEWSDGLGASQGWLETLIRNDQSDLPVFVPMMNSDVDEWKNEWMYELISGATLICG